MAKKKTTSEGEVFHDPEAFAERLSSSEAYIRKNINIIGAAILLVAGAIVGIYYYMQHKEEKEHEAQLDFYKAQYFWMQDSIDVALNGREPEVLGLNEIVKRHDGTKAAELAHFMIGKVHLDSGRFDQAINHLNKYDAGDLLVQARAYAMIGDANMELEKYDQAVKFYSQAAKHEPNDQTTPRYLAKLALAYEVSDKRGEAVLTYEKLLENHPQARKEVLDEAKKHMARLKAALHLEQSES